MTMLTESPISTSTQEKPLPKPHQQFPSEIKEMQGQEHFEICARFATALSDLFATDENANVGGDQGFYWNGDDDRDLVAPDAYLIRNAGKALRKSWKFWEERAAYPNLTIEFVLEVWSESNKPVEREQKLQEYQMLGAKEFFQLEYPDRELFGHRLNESGVYELIEPRESGRLFSQGLNAELIFEDGLLRLYRDGKRVLTLLEAQAELDAERLAKEAERQRAEAERQAKEVALAEIERLKKELGRA